MSSGATRKVKEEMKMAHHPVKVVIRCRPFSEKEIHIHGKEAGILLDEEKGTVTVLNPRDKNVHRKYAFDGVYGPESTQEAVYIGCCKAVTDSVLDGFNGSIIAYGQTGTGKTYTMEGDLKSKEQLGMMFRVVQHIFSSINGDTSRNFQVNLSYIEIYQDTLRDLLNISGKKLKMHEFDNGIYVDGLSNVTCTDFADVLKWYHHGKVSRRTRSTNMSIASSRSHTILKLTVTSFDDAKTVKTGILNLVDLAGSESQKKAGTKGEALKEASKMNNSLSTLGKVVSMISSGSHRHIPYRDCKLTRVLQESLGGNCFTTILATVGPCVSDLEETLSTLRFSASARNLKKAVKANLSPRCGEGALIKDKIRSLSHEEFKEMQVQELKEKLRLISLNLAVHPNDLALQDMANSCKAKIKQILWLHEEINEVLGNKEQLEIEKDADTKITKKESEQFQNKENVTRDLLVSIECFQQEVSNVMSNLRAQIQGLKHLAEEEDVKSVAKTSLSDTNILAQAEALSRSLQESARSLQHEISAGIQGTESHLKNEDILNYVFLRDKPLKECLQSRKTQPKIMEEDILQQTTESVSFLSIENAPKVMASKSTQVLKGDLQNKDTVLSELSTQFTVLNFKIGFYQLVSRSLLDAKKMLLMTNKMLKDMNKESKTLAHMDNFFHDSVKAKKLSI